MKAMILAAGRGKRMRPLTDHTPKPLLPAGRWRLIEHHLHHLADAGIRDVVINIAWLGEQIPAYLGRGERYGLAISYSDEGDQALETAGGIRRALPLLGNDPFLVVNGDVWTRYPLGEVPKEPEGLAHLVMVKNPAHNPAGDFGLDATGRLTEDGHERYTYSGIGVFRPELFAGLPDEPLPLGPVLRKAMQQGKVTGELYRGEWRDIGTPERLQRLQETLDHGPGDRQGRVHR